MIAFRGDPVICPRGSNVGGPVLGVGCSDPFIEAGSRRLLRSKLWQKEVWLVYSLEATFPGAAEFPNASYLHAIFIFSSGAGAGWEDLDDLLSG